MKDNDNQKTVALDQPIKREGKDVTSVTVRKPNSGALRGVSLLDLSQLDVGALQKVLPRVTEPPLHQDELIMLDPADLMQLGVAVVGFLLPKSQRDQLSQQQ